MASSCLPMRSPTARYSSAVRLSPCNLSPTTQRLVEMPAHNAVPFRTEIPQLPAPLPFVLPTLELHVAPQPTAATNRRNQPPQPGERHYAEPRGHSSDRQSACFASRGSWVQIPLPPPSSPRRSVNADGLGEAEGLPVGGRQDLAWP